MSLRSMAQWAMAYRIGQTFGLPVCVSKPIVSGGILPCEIPPPQLSGGCNSCASFHGAEVKYGSPAVRGMPCGFSQYCTLLSPDTPTCATPEIGTGCPVTTSSG